MDFVTVIIPVYNREESILRAAWSVLGQTYQNFEIIIVDDGSTDKTSDIVRSLAKDDQRICYLKSEKNMGAQAARNTGIRAAKGDWISFLDSDDQWLPHSLEIRMKMAKIQGVKVVHSVYYIIREDGNKKLCTIRPLKGWVYREVLSKPGPTFQSLLVAKEAIERIGYLDERLQSWQEWDTSIRLARYFPFGFVTEPTFIYDCRNMDRISTNMLQDAFGYEYIVKKYFFEILFHNGPRSLSCHYRFVAKRYLETDAQVAMKRCKIKAFLCWPFDATLDLKQII